MEILQPPDWARPRGFSNGIAARGRMVFVSGMVGWDARNKLVSSDFSAQVRQALLNIVQVLAEAQARPEHIVRMTWYVVDKKEYLAASKAVGVVYRELMGAHYPAMTAVEVSDLVEDGARVEIEATAVVPEKD
jgi:enamine deaminase RidA (YjgF/YER057c/UK114 family)